MCLSAPAVSTIFNNNYALAPLFLTLLAIQYTYTAAGSLSAANLINGQGQTTYILYLTALTAAIGFPTGYILIMNYGVMGLIITTLTANIPSLILSVRFVRKRYGVTIDWNSSTRILLSSALTAALTYLLISQLNFASWIRLIIGVAVFTLIIIPTIILTRAINLQDINNIRSMLSTLGPISSILNHILNLFEKAMNKLKLK